MRVRLGTGRHPRRLDVTPFQAVVLGVVQGLSEFLPISSKTHLIVVPALLGWTQPDLASVVFLHLGTLVALLAYFARDLWQIAADAARGGEGRRTVALLAVASMPAAVAGLLLESTVERLVARPRLAAAALLVTAVLLVCAEWLAGAVGRRMAKPVRERVGYTDALGMGAAQAVALLPGISRSGSTMGAGIALGVSREAAARFSFLMAIAAIAGANVLEFRHFSDLQTPGVAVAGFAASLVSGYGAVWGLLRYVRSHTFLPFAAYCALFAVVSSLRLA